MFGDKGVVVGPIGCARGDIAVNTMRPAAASIDLL
jgi:hypothetical protein